ncbi:MAG: ABC transporter permease subunit [Anaerolineales bacterium]|nr:ABC transporter permease subunit [Anaerolineales bacterium]
MPPLARYTLRRLVLTVITLFGVVIAVFIMTHILPSDPAALRAGPLASEELIEQYQQEMGLDKPLYVQFFNYATLLMQGDLGDSWRTEQPVVDELGQRLPATLELAATAFVFALIIGITLGILAAVYAGTWVDHVARLVATLGAALALFWLALVGVHIFYFNLDLAPPPLGRLTVGMEEPATVTGLLLVDSLIAGDIEVFLDAANHLWLPALTLAFVVSAPIIKIMRAAMLDSLGSDYVRTARALGVNPMRVVLADALRNALIPVLTTLGIVFGYLIAGNVIIERVFSWPGIGQYAWTALITNDFNAVQGFVLLIAVVYVLINLSIDLAYGYIDPRIRLG